MSMTPPHEKQSRDPLCDANCIDSITPEPTKDITTSERSNALVSPTQPRQEPEKKEITDGEADNEEPMRARIERLSRARPPVFRSFWAEIAFVFSICMSQVVTEVFVSGFTVILPTLIEELEIPRTSSVWPATAFSLAIASTLLFFGRLGDMYGGYVIYVGGFLWLTFWSVIVGFSSGPLMLDFCRALQGLGAAAYLPNGLLLMGSTYRPGPRKNLVFSVYGACAVTGFFVGIFVAGVVAEHVRWVGIFGSGRSWQP